MIYTETAMLWMSSDIFLSAYSGAVTVIVLLALTFAL